MYVTENQLKGVYVDLFDENANASVYLAFLDPTVFTYDDDTVICSKDGAITVNCNTNTVMKICYQIPDSNELIKSNDPQRYTVNRICYESKEGVAHTVFSKVYSW